MSATPMMPPNLAGGNPNFDGAPPAPTPPGTDMTGICFRDQLWLNTYPLDRNLVFDYFALSPFYDWTCNNEQLRTRSIHPLELSELSKMTGMEYMLYEVMEPHLFVIRKQKRDSPEKVTPMLTYYVLVPNSALPPKMDVKDLESKSSSPHIPASNNAQDEEDDLPTLSSFALEALKEFLSEQNYAVTNDAGEGEERDLSLLPEDWRMSQFWYTPETAETVATEVNHLCNELEESVTPSIACISCPTLFVYLKKMYPNISARLLEYDTRFKQYGGDYTFYDYNEPENLPQELKHCYQILVIDPPYLSEECLEKVAQTVSYLAHPRNCHLLLLTGDVQRDRAAQLLKLQPCGFRPQHSSKLGNEFRLFTNYDPGARLGGWDFEE